MDDYLTYKIDDMRRRMKEAKSDSCRISWARKLVAARHEAGEYFIQGPLSEEVLEALARAAEVEACSGQ